MTVKKKQCCIIAVLAILVVIVGIAAIPHSTKIMRGGGAENATAVQSTSQHKKSPTIKIGVSSLEPFFYMGRDGKNIGIDADLARKACKRIGVTPKFVSIPSGETDAYLENGKIDCVWNAFAINGREDRYRWTTSYLDTPLAMIVDAGNPSRSIYDFRGPSGVAVRVNSVAESLFLDGGYATLAATGEAVKVNSYGTTEMAETAFAKGLTDALVSYKLVLDKFIADQSKLATYRYINDDLAMLHLGVAFPKDSTSPYIDKLNTAIQEMKDDGTIDAVVKKYEVSTPKEADDAQ